MSDNLRREEKYTLITSSSIYPLLWKMATPAILGMIAISIYSVADTYFIGKLNKTHLTAAVGIVFSFVSIIGAVGFWFGYGAGNFISNKIGQKQFIEAEEMASTAFVISIVTGLTITVLGLLFIKPLAAILGGLASKSTLMATMDYLRIVLYSVSFTLCANVLYNMLRLSGSARDAMIGALVGVVLNIILDPIFIFWFKLGIKGAGYASLIGQFTAFVILLYLTGKRGNINVSLNKFLFKCSYIKKILLGGLPNFSRQLVSSVSLVLFNNVAGEFGESAVAAVTIVLRVLTVLYAFGIGFGQGFQLVCAMNYGAKNYGRVKKAFSYTLITITIYFVLVSLVLFFKSLDIVLLFTSEEAVLNTASTMLIYQSAVISFMGLYILIGMMLQNIGQFLKATLVTVAENGIFFIPLVMIIPTIYGFDGFLLVRPLSSALALLLSIIIGIRSWKKYLC